MTGASVRKVLGAADLKAPRWALSGGALVALACVATLFDGAYGPVQILILATAFILVIGGADLFGLLLTRPAKRLGDISYGIYLLQGPVLYLVCAPPRFRAFAAGSALGHWTMTMIAATVLVLVATLTHILIERPGVRLGRRVMRLMAPAE
jgi:peptidoglycan/LPS O-acetylase OafA/YrhL